MKLFRDDIDRDQERDISDIKDHEIERIFVING